MNDMKQMPDAQKTIGLEQAFVRYEEIRERLPEAAPPPVPRLGAGLLDTFDEFDGYLFDSFGVLNVGETAIAGAAECLQELRERSKPFCILTNAASYTSAEAFKKYQRLGLDVRQDEIVSSRDVLFLHLEKRYPGLTWGAIAAREDEFSDSRSHLVHLDDTATDWDAVEGILFLSAARWTEAKQARLIESLLRKPRPVLVGNPDLVAPREDGLTVEPGFWAHEVQDQTGIAIECFGKPYPEAFELAAARIGSTRLAMIGDTLHTDILGGQAAGFGTVLVTDHGLFAGRAVAPYIERSGIVPSWIIPSI